MTEADVAAQKRALEYLGDDAKRLANLNVHAPFTGHQDAIDRLFPFHALAHEDAEDADDDYVYGHEGSELLCSRGAVWQELSARQALELSARVDKVRRSVVKAQADAQAQKQHLLPEEKMVINQMMLTVSKRLLDQAVQRRGQAAAGASQAGGSTAAPAAGGVPGVKQEAVKAEPMVLG